MNSEEKLNKIKDIIEVYFMPWGACKAAMWEDLSNDGLFTAEKALELIRKIQ